MLHVARTLLLDLDGTLVHTLPALTGALNRLDPVPHFQAEETVRWVSGSLDAFLERACAARGRSVTPDLTDAFRMHYEAHMAELSRPFAAVLPTLRHMLADGWTLAVCTEQPEHLAIALLRAMGFAGVLAAVVGADTYDVCKPDPRHLLATIRASDGELERAVMVGDHAEDVAAARAAGIPCIFAGWGYGPLNMAQGASAICMGFPDVHGLAARLLAPGDD
jgi:phosphoglycolate phosphatase